MSQQIDAPAALALIADLYGQLTATRQELAAERQGRADDLVRYTEAIEAAAGLANDSAGLAPNAETGAP